MMDTALSRALAGAIPSASSPGWGTFLLALLAAVALTLLLAPRLIDAYRRFKYSDPGEDRRAQPECQLHTARIQELEEKVRRQQAEIEAVREANEATRVMLQNELRDLREFIEEKFRQDHQYSQAERLAQEERISAQIGHLVTLLKR